MTGVISFAYAVGGDTLIAAMMLACLLLTFFIIHAALAPKGDLRGRLASLAGRRELSRLGIARPAASKTGKGTTALLDALKALVEHLKLTRGDEAQKTANLLVQAGWRTREALVVYLGIRLLLPLALTSITLLAVMAFGIFGFQQMMAGAIAALVGLLLPATVVRRMIKKRHLRFHRAVPDALDLLVICAEAGLGLDGALNRVSREFRRFQPEVAEELALTGLELGFLPNRREALTNLTKRVDIAGVRSLVHTLIQTERYGTPLSQALKTISADLRDERMLRAEEKAARLPATMTVPMILFILPAVFIIIIGPAIIQLMATF